ncbi:hypothetical protein [Alkalihalobacillus deserti]|uniref:hypothetical protein n=1 Tax=Alkalihalobacillus deserti TaxID=2879466 RepID=UPI001D13D52B|nr:hypothetical protein [Alkalihalobacillus deserti]
MDLGACLSQSMLKSSRQITGSDTGINININILCEIHIGKEDEKRQGSVFHKSNRIFLLGIATFSTKGVRLLSRFF